MQTSFRSPASPLMWDKWLDLPSDASGASAWAVLRVMRHPRHWGSGGIPGSYAPMCVCNAPRIALSRPVRAAMVGDEDRTGDFVGTSGLQPGRAGPCMARGPAWSVTRGGAPPRTSPPRRSPQRTKLRGGPQKKAPADRLRKTERVQGRRTARQQGLTQPVIPIMLRETMRMSPRGSGGWR